MCENLFTCITYIAASSFFLCSFPFWDLRGSITDVLGKYWPRSKGVSLEDIGTNNKRVFIRLNKLPSGY